MTNTLVQTLIETSVWESYTYDYAELRYRGPQNVFLYDPPGAGLIKHLGLVWGRDIKRMVDPFYSSKGVYLVHDRNAVYTKKPRLYEIPAGFLNKFDKESLSQIDYKQRHAKGSMYQVGLYALSAFDYLYSNGFGFNRREEYVNRVDGTGTTKAWVYWSSLRSLCDYDAHTQKFSFKKDVQISDVPHKENPSGGSFWEMKATP